MPVTPIAFRVETAQELEDYLNTLLAPLLNIRLMGVEIDQVKPGPFFTRNIYCALTTDAGAAMVSPFQFKQVSQPTEAAALDKLQQFIAANPAYFFSPVFAVYRPQNPDPEQGVILGMFYSADPTASTNWGYPSAGGAPGGPAGGDLYGVYPNPQVGGLRGVPILAGAPATGDQYIYDPVAGGWRVAAQYRYFANSAAAILAAPFINGTFVVLYPGSPTSEAGTYQVTANGGVAFPADYTKISDATDTAAEVAIVDAGGFYAWGLPNVEAALQEIAAGRISAVPVSPGVGVFDMITFNPGQFQGGVFHVLLRDSAGTNLLVYETTLVVATNGVSANLNEVDPTPGPGVGIPPFSFDAVVSGGLARVQINLTDANWSFTLRSMALQSI